MYNYKIKFKKAGLKAFNKGNALQEECFAGGMFE